MQIRVEVREDGGRVGHLLGGGMSLTSTPTRPTTAAPI
jgi:hypothetical protein